MQTPPVISLQITASPTLPNERLRLIFERAEGEGISPEAFVERAIARALDVEASQPEGAGREAALAA